MDLKVKDDLGNLFTGLVPFLDQFGAMRDFLEQFFNANFLPSKVATDILNLQQEESEPLNQKFLDLKIPFRCFAESKQTNVAAVNRKYWIVNPELSLLDEENALTIHETDHIDIPRFDCPTNEIYRGLSDLIDKTIV